MSPYQCNMDYYRGKVKSVYEKEPYFKVSQILRGRKQKSCRFFCNSFNSEYQNFCLMLFISTPHPYKWNRAIDSNEFKSILNTTYFLILPWDGWLCKSVVWKIHKVDNKFDRCRTLCVTSHCLNPMCMTPTTWAASRGGSTPSCPTGGTQAETPPQILWNLLG